MKQITISIIFLLFSTISFAESWTSDLTVERVFTEGASDLIIVYTSGGSVYSSGCLVNKWSFKADTEARRSRAYSTLISALVSGKKVNFWYADSCGPWSYHEAKSVMLIK